MKKLTTVSKTVWILLILLAIATVTLIVFICLYHVDKTIRVKLQVNDKKDLTLLANDKTAYLLKKNQKIIINVNDQIFNLKIRNLKIENQTIKVTFYNLPNSLKLLPNTTLDATIFVDRATLLNLILNS
ncbi:MAG1140 family protein [Mycoplasmopsis fermentans]|uniref:Uncharacterized protein n=1 Tax=Mycoplasmopsis fermentans (strain M64) TaxID=943945 RepID=A0AB32XAW0_MYCFM|nr:hypothetical protein [Mycoplasmopsis fermentans]VEU66870.1 Uncharacterised protein [Mesomycoplasma conjunctivae]ADV34094.1 Conserved Hypothetical Protein [Mycoplasmopsis fermentans M64]RMX36250.1 hypothetical protein MFI2_0081 [Mycoplasmopsis fermentans MF-I2]RMX36328.1 hypothetical protein MFI1_0069 [Mycoplasmopsis fermentans MF-I1]VEU60122.1 Uncharacterised protein [Mycoplasmopsis fermentans]